MLLIESVCTCVLSGTAQAKASPVDREKTETLQGVIKQVWLDVLVRCVYVTKQTLAHPNV